MNEIIEKTFSKIEEKLEIPVDKTSELVMEIAAAVNPLLGLIQPIMKKTDEIKIGHLLLGLANGLDVERKINQLYIYASTKERAEYISNVFRQALLNYSRIGTVMMGLQLSKLMDDDRNLNQEDLVIFNTLSDLNDFDILNFIEIYDYWSMKEKEEKLEDFILEEDLHQLKGDNIDNIIISLDKLGKSGIIQMGRSGGLFDGRGNLAFEATYKINRITEKFYQMIKEAQQCLRDVL